jgi:quinol monooxygenase YgiN
MPRIGMYNMFIAKPGEMPTLLRALAAICEVLEGYSECESFIVALPVHDGSTVCVAEVWTSDDAHDSVRWSEPIKGMIEPVLAALAAPPSQVRMEVVRIKRSSPGT